MNKIQIILGVGVVLVIGGFLIFTKPFVGTDQPSTRTNREVALACDREMAEGFHIHQTLEIVANGEKVLVPANIGVQATCMTALHTHTPDGLIHVESPEKRDFMLADFFAVWDKPFNKDQILDFKVDETHTITMQINEVLVETFENTVLKDGDRIVITYGSK